MGIEQWVVKSFELVVVGDGARARGVTVSTGEERMLGIVGAAEGVAGGGGGGRGEEGFDHGDARGGGEG